VTHHDFTSVVGARIALGLFLAGLLFLSYPVLHLFIAPAAWAIILYTSPGRPPGGRSACSAPGRTPARCS
jgi:hypothetical protein